MQYDWPTQTEDMQAAEHIVGEYTELNEEEPLGLLKVIVNPPMKQVEVKVSDWVLQLLLHFSEQYGHEKGRDVTSKVVTRLILRHETIH